MSVAFLCRLCADGGSAVGGQEWRWRSGAIHHWRRSVRHRHLATARPWQVGTSEKMFFNVKIRQQFRSTRFCFSKREYLGRRGWNWKLEMVLLRIPVTPGSGAGDAVARWMLWLFHFYQGLKLNLALGGCLAMIFLLPPPPHMLLKKSYN